MYPDARDVYVLELNTVHCVINVEQMTRRFEPITGKTAEIVEALMNSQEMPDDPGLQFKLRLCIEEVVENVVSYAYDNGNGPLEVGITNNTEKVSISFKDQGIPFDPLAKPDPDITLAAEDRPIGGLGIFLCKQMMDDVRYSFEDGCNVLYLIKNLQGE